MSEFKLITCLEQEVVVDGTWELPFDDGLLVKIINYNAACDADEISEMDNPKRMFVKIAISTREI